MFRTVKYYQDAAEECYRLSNLFVADSAKEAMIRLGDAYMTLAGELKDHETKVETKVNRVLRHQARALHDESLKDEGTAQGA